MPTAKKMIQIASSYIGTSGDYNIFNKWYWVDYTHKYSSDPGTAWCACFQSYVAMKAGLKCEYSASAAGFATQFERIPVEKEDQVRQGDIVIFNWDGRTSTGWADHVGIVEWSTIGENGRFGTIEGNTGDKAEGQVLRVTRNNWTSYFTAFYRPKYDSASASSSSTPSSSQTAPSQSKATKLYGIDVSSNQPASICKDVANDFGIVKVSGNPQGYAWNYVNPYAKQQADDAFKKHGRLGLYHFTWGKSDANVEADFFWNEVKKLGYSDKAVLVIDYEAEALEKGRAWVKKFADRLKALSGRQPVIYASGSVIVAQKLLDLGYPLWCANYYRGYESIDGYDTSGMKIYSGCESSVLWQYTSQGYLKGYGGPLDCNVFFGSGDDWKKMAGISPGGSPKPEPAPVDPPATQTGKRYRVTAQPSLNVRAKRSASSKLKGSLAYGTLVYLTDVKADAKGNTWGQISKGQYAGYFVAVKYDGKVLAERHYGVETIAKQVINGKWGNGSERKKRLETHGYSYDKIQAKVNELLG